MLLLRKPLLFLLVLAGTASLAAGGRLSLRLLFDTAITLAPVVVLQWLAFLLVFWSGSRPMRAGEALDRFFDGYGVWYALLTGLAAFTSLATPVLIVRWFMTIFAGALLFGVAASIWFDLRYYRSALGRSPTRAAGDVVLQRALAWPPTLGYFLFTASPKLLSPLEDLVNLLTRTS